MTPTPKPGVLSITPYVGGRASVPGLSRAVKLSSNESALGASPAAVEAFNASSADLWTYPEGSARLLRNAIGEVHHIDPERVVCGNGSDELLSLLAHTYLRPGDEVLFTEHAFLVYRIAALANSAAPIAVPEVGHRADVHRLLGAVTERTRLVYLANPNNPTGSYISAGELRRLHRGLPPSTLLVVDAAYAEYVQRDDYDPGTALASTSENVVMTRTFSKIYGLAGLRVGWAYCPPPIADALNRVRGPFNVSVPSQRAAAAALLDRAHVARAVAHNEEWKAWLQTQIRAAGLRVDDSVGNFLLIHFPPTGPHSAPNADTFLASKGYILRGVANYGLPDCLRLTIASEEANRGVAAAIAEFMSDDRP